MNVYVGTSGVLKNDYIGEVYEYSYDFRNKTVEQIQADGWSLSRTPTINSNGITGPAVNIIRSMGDLTRNAKKITLISTFGLYSSAAMGLRMAHSVNNPWDGITGMFITTGSSNNRTPIIYDTASTYNGLPDGAYTNTNIIDLENKKFINKTTGLSDIEITMTDTQVNNIKANTNYIYCYYDNARGSGYLQSISITIE